MIDLIKGDKYIYKYVPFNENTLKSLIKGELWFGPLKNFNDPFDGEFDISNFDKNIDKRNEYLKTRLKDELPDYYFDGEPKYELQLRHQLKKLIKQDIKDRLGITCFSKKPDNLLMWSHYAAGHTGLCLIFDREKLHKSLSYRPNYRSKVGYIEFGEENYIDSICKIEVDFPDNKSMETRFIDIISYKKKDWAYEEEIRFFFHFNRSSDIRALKFNKESLQGIIFGYKTQPDNIYSLDCMVKEMKSYEHLTAFNMRFKKDDDLSILPGVPYDALMKANFIDDQHFYGQNRDKNWKRDLDYYE
jgi:hypothetical protein